MTPQEQKAYSPLYINEKYGGDPANIPGVTQLPNGLYSGQPGIVYDVNPNTGQRGTFRFLGTMGFVDESPQYEGTTRNRHGIYQGEPGAKYTFNPNTGEEGDWIWLGTMGWVNTKGDPQDPLPEGTISFDDYYGGPDGNSSASGDFNNTDIDNDLSSTIESTDTNLNSSGMMSGGSSSGGSSFSPSTPMGLNYAAPQAMQIAQAPKVDYAKILNNLLIADVFGGMMTGKNV